MKISELTPTEVLNDEDIFPVVQDGETKNIKRKDLFKHISAPSEDDDVASKKYVDEKVKGNTPTVDDEVKAGSKNPVSSDAVINFTDKKALRKWYAMSVEKFKDEPCSLKFEIGKTNSNDGQPEYSAFLGFSFYVAKSVGADYVVQPLTDIPFEFNNDTDKHWLNWTNKEKFPTFGIISNQMGTEPVDLYKQIETFVDGSIFHKSAMSMGVLGFQVGYYEIGFSVSISSQIEGAIDTLIEELSQIIPTITHYCIAYENYEIVEANGIGE